MANNQLKVHDQVMLLEGSQATVQTVQALRSGAHAMKEVSRQTNIENVEQVCGCVGLVASPLLSSPRTCEPIAEATPSTAPTICEYGSADAPRAPTPTYPWTSLCR